VGTFVLIFISELFRGLGMYSPFVPAALLALVVYLLPNGLVSLPGIVWSRLLNRDKKGTDHAS
jgi:ABC-type branched-subunit amino acid transport system permease subunit